MISYMRYLFLELLAYCELPESPWRRSRAGGADTELEGVGSSGEQQEAARTKAHADETKLPGTRARWVTVVADLVG